MSRKFKGGDDESYRVLAEFLTSDGEVVYGEMHFGPYANRAVALREARVQLDAHTTFGRKARIHIERTATKWESVEVLQ